MSTEQKKKQKQFQSRVVDVYVSTRLSDIAVVNCVTCPVSMVIMYVVRTQPIPAVTMMVLWVVEAVLRYIATSMS